MKWVGVFPTDKTKRQRQSKMTNKMKRKTKSFNLDWVDRKVPEYGID